MSENVKKIKIDKALHARMEAHETQLRERIQAGQGTPAMRYALEIVQEHLAEVEIDETWSDEPTPPECA